MQRYLRVLEQCAELVEDLKPEKVGLCQQLLPMILCFLTLPLINEERNQSSAVHAWIFTRAHAVQGFSLLSSESPAGKNPSGYLVTSHVWIVKESLA